MEENNKIQPVLLHEYAQQKSEFKVAALAAQRVYGLVKTAYDRLGIGEVNSIPTLFEISQNPEGVVRNVELAKMSDTLYGVKISKAKMADFIELPDLTELKNASAALKQNAFMRTTKVHEFELFSIVDGKVIINQSEYDLHMKALEIWATTPEEVERFKLFQNLADSVHAIAEVNPNLYRDAEIPGLKRLYPNKYKPHHEYIKIRR